MHPSLAQVHDLVRMLGGRARSICEHRALVTNTTTATRSRDRVQQVLARSCPHVRAM